jgi:hypothetical protein
MAEQTDASKSLGTATSTQGADKEPSPAPILPAFAVALASRRKRDKNWTTEEQKFLMDAYAKTAFDSERVTGMTAKKFSEKLFEGFLSSPWCPSREKNAFRGSKMSPCSTAGRQGPRMQTPYARIA